VLIIAGNLIPVYHYFEDVLGLNKMLNKKLMPHACNQVTSLVTVMASTKHPFHNMYTGHDMRKLKNSKVATAKMIAKSFSMIISLGFIKKTDYVECQ
jgi:hypothetical protein